MALYAPEFKSGNLDRRRWRAKKLRLFRQPGAIKVELASLNIMARGDTAVAGFIQRFTSSPQSQLGQTILVLRRAQGGWKIMKESWRPLAELPPGVSF